MYKESVKYTDNNLEETINLIDSFDANFGGTEIAQPLLDIVKNDKKMSDFIRHVIVLTDGQVSNSNEVIQIIKTMKTNHVATTHMVGIGNGVSF